ncbi:MAG: hypothetical protein R3B72_34380 [Polyangiaceae bacterium]
MRSSLRAALALVLLSLLALPSLGCRIRITQGGKRRDLPEPLPSSTTAGTDATPAPTVDPMALPPPPSDCPTDMARQAGAATIDTRKSSGLPPGVYHQMRWPKGHREPPADDFFLAPGAAVDAVVKVEARQPGMVPAGYRERLSAAPRDGRLRLHMARCELEVDELRRRASHDAVMALLLGVPFGEVAPILLESTKNADKQKYTTTCADGRCSGDSRCDPQHKVCVTPLRAKLSRITAGELEIEDALTRALMQPFYAEGKATDSDDPRFWWAVYRVHRCAPSICAFTKYNRDGQVALVRWDNRDGGTSYGGAPRPRPRPSGGSFGTGSVGGGQVGSSPEPCREDCFTDAP